MKYYLSGFGIAVIVLSTIAAMANCSNPVPERKPEASSVIREFSIGFIDVAEFRDSAGRICVLATNGSNADVEIDCARALPPLDYEDLPEADDERGIVGKRPL